MSEKENINNFSFKLTRLYGHRSSWNDNFVFSPLGISISLGLLTEGSNYETRRELREAIGQQFYSKYVKKEFVDGKFVKEFDEIFTGVTLSPKFKRKIKQKFGANTSPSFMGNKNDVASAVNNWVTDVTNDYIHSFVTESTIANDSNLIIANAVIVKVGWLYEFSRRKTVLEDFYLNPNKAVKVPMMKLRACLRVSLNDEIKILLLEIPCECKRYAAFVLLSMSQIPMKNICEVLNAHTYRKLVENLTICSAVVTLPKFKITVSEDITWLMKNLGIFSAFTHLANFSKMSEDVVKLSVIGHYTSVIVDEDGVIASSGIGKPHVDKRMKRSLPVRRISCNKPFVFIIHDFKTGCIVTSALINDPSLR